MKKISLVVVFMLLVCCSCAEKDNTEISKAIDTEDVITENIIVNTQMRFLTFDEAVDLSDCAAIAEFVSYKDNGGYIEYTFNVKEVLRGEIPEKTIHVFSSKGFAHVEGTDYTYEIGNDIYTVGEAYLLIMERNDSLFYEYPHHLLVTDIFLPEKDAQKSTMYGQRFADIAGKKSTDDIRTHIMKAKEPGRRGGERYTAASDWGTIVKESDLILKVKITGLMVEGITGNSNTYYCEVLDALKGDSIARREDILISLVKGSVDVGETYIVLVNRVGEQSSIYTQSSKKSVIPLSDTKAINQMQKLV